MNDFSDYGNFEVQMFKAKDENNEIFQQLDTLSYCFSFLSSTKDLANVALVSKKWRAASENIQLWKKFGFNSKNWLISKSQEEANTCNSFLQKSFLNIVLVHDDRLGSVQNRFILLSTTSKILLNKYGSEYGISKNSLNAPLNKIFSTNKFSHQGISVVFKDLNPKISPPAQFCDALNQADVVFFIASPCYDASALMDKIVNLDKKIIFSNKSKEAQITDKRLILLDFYETDIGEDYVESILRILIDKIISISNKLKTADGREKEDNSIPSLCAIM